MAKPYGYEDLEDDLLNLYHKEEVHVLVSMLKNSELETYGLQKQADLCEKIGIEYVRFPILDRTPPTSLKETYALCQKLRTFLFEGKNVVCHCMAGIGRSSTIAACTMFLFDVSVVDSFRLITAARGFNVPDTRTQYKWTVVFKEFLNSKTTL